MKQTSESAGGEIRVLIVDDHAMVRQGLRTFLELQDDAAGPEETAESHEALVKLARGVAGLRPEQRAAIALRYEAGLTYDQVAAAMGIPMNTVRTHLHRAKAALREWMEAGDVGLDG